MRFADVLSDVGRPVAYYPKLRQITGSVTATLFLCQLAYWHGKGKRTDGWIWKTKAEMQKETGLSRREQDTARKALKKRGFIEESKRGIPARLHYRLKLDAIEQAWKEVLAQKEQTRMAESAEQERRNPPNSGVGMRHCNTDSTQKNTTEREEGTSSLSTETRNNASDESSSNDNDTSTIPARSAVGVEQAPSSSSPRPELRSVDGDERQESVLHVGTASSPSDCECRKDNRQRQTTTTNDNGNDDSTRSVPAVPAGVSEEDYQAFLKVYEDEVGDSDDLSFSDATKHLKGLLAKVRVDELHTCLEWAVENGKPTGSVGILKKVAKDWLGSDDGQYAVGERERMAKLQRTVESIRKVLVWYRDNKKTEDGGIPETIEAAMCVWAWATKYEQDEAWQWRVYDAMQAVKREFGEADLK